jgi:hypothetical protein
MVKIHRKKKLVGMHAYSLLHERFADDEKRLIFRRLPAAGAPKDSAKIGKK